MKGLARKFKENGVPATVGHTNISWDASDIASSSSAVVEQSELTTDSYVIQTQTGDTNQMQCVIRFDRTGKYSFVSKSVFVKPPKLPPYPGSKKPMPSYAQMSFNILLASIVLFVLSGVIPTSLNSVFNFVAAILLVVGAFGLGQYIRIEAHNRGIDEQIAAYVGAWNTWEATQLRATFQEAVSGEVTRVYDAAYECMKQLNEELFKSKPLAEESEEEKMSAIASIVAEKQQDFR